METIVSNIRQWWQPRRAFSMAEIIADAVVHGIGIVNALALGTVLIVFAAIGTARPELPAIILYVVSLVTVLGISLAFNIAPISGFKKLMARLDQAAIFLFIAGTYTPFMLGSMAEQGGYWILGLVWAVAVVGTVAKCANRLTHPVLSTGLYLGLGWLSVFILEPLMSALPTEGLALIVSGGVLYTLGAVVFHFDDRIRYGHFIWHLLVLGASGCHFLAVLRYVVA